MQAGEDPVLQHRQGAAPAKDLKGPKLADALPDSPAHNDKLLGQIDGVEGGQISGWACFRGSRNAAPLQVTRNSNPCCMAGPKIQLLGPSSACHQPKVAVCAPLSRRADVH